MARAEEPRWLEIPGGSITGLPVIREQYELVHDRTHREWYNPITSVEDGHPP
jgi:hypothetical protein